MTTTRIAALCAALSAATIGQAVADTAETSGRFQKDFQLPNVTINHTSSTGTVCLHVRSGSTTNPSVASTGSCTIPASTALAGRGRSNPKFRMEGGFLVSENDDLSNLADSSSGGVATSASATADWGALFFPVGADSLFGAYHNVSGRVARMGAIGNPGRAAGNSRDPLTFSVSAPGSLAYTATISDLIFRSDTGFGRNLYSVVTRIENVSRAGVPSTGTLWSLSITSTGRIVGNGNLQIVLYTWPPLGISDAQRLAAIDYLRAQIENLGDGSFGYLGDVPFFGGGGPLPALTLDYTPGTIRYYDDLIADAELSTISTSVPALPVWSMLVLMAIFAATAARGFPNTRR